MERRYMGAAELHTERRGNARRNSVLKRGRGAECRGRATASTAEQATSEWVRCKEEMRGGEGIGGRPKLGLTKGSIENVECGDGPKAGPGGGKEIC